MGLHRFFNLMLILTIGSALLARVPNGIAREVDLPSELVTDVVLGASAWGIQRLAPEDARYQGDEFPTQALDDKAHRSLHGKPTGQTPTVKERRYRAFSNGAVVASSALPAAMALLTYDDEALGRVLTTGHALLFSNLVVTSLKHSIRRPRPAPRQEADKVATRDNAASFPSGHASAAFTGATLVSCFFPTSSWWVRGGAFALAGATAFARVAGDKHFLSDVAVGAGIGMSSAIIVDRFYAPTTAGVSVQVGSDTVELVYRF